MGLVGMQMQQNQRQEIEPLSPREARKYKILRDPKLKDKEVVLPRGAVELSDEFLSPEACANILDPKNSDLGFARPAREPAPNRHPSHQGQHPAHAPPHSEGI